MTRWALVIPLAVTVSGCAYFNGLYNANQLAAEAARAEEQGRPGEARSLWVRAAVKAESVAVRYPESGHYDDALLMQGRALSRSGACLDAQSPLERVMAISADARIWTSAGLLLAECLLALQHADSARSVLLPFVHHWDSSVVFRALWLRGRAALAEGDVQAALDDLSRTTMAAAVLDRAAALVAAGRVAEAASELDSARSLPFDEQQWSDILDAVGRADPVAASTIVDSLVDHEGLTAGQSARLLLDDADRWRDRDPARQRQRLVRAAAVAGDSVENRIAQSRLLENRLRTLTILDSLPGIRRELDRLAGEGGQVATETRQWRRVLADGMPALNAAGGEVVQLFRFAEEVRDGLDAPRLAARLFMEIADRSPDSPFAPKALLAAATTWREMRERALARLTRMYPDSPYTRAAAGLPAPGFEALEDSLRSVLGSPRPNPVARPDGGSTIPAPVLPDTTVAGTEGLAS